MYSTDIVISAVQIALARRGYEYPRRGERGKNTTVARIMAADALHYFSRASNSGAATAVNCSTASGKSLRLRASSEQWGRDDRDLWIAEVRAIIDSIVQKSTQQ